MCLFLTIYVDGVATPFDEIKKLLNTIRNDKSEHYKEFRSFRAQMESDFQFLRDDLSSLNDSVSNLSMSLQEHKEQTLTEMTSIKTTFNSTESSQASQTLHIRKLRNKLDTLNIILNALNTTMNTQINPFMSKLTTCLQEHKQQTTTELSHLQTSLTSTHSKLDTLTNTTASNHQQIIDSMPDVECMDTQTNCTASRKPAEQPHTPAVEY